MNQLSKYQSFWLPANLVEGGTSTLRSCGCALHFRANSYGSVESDVTIRERKYSAIFSPVSRDYLVLIRCVVYLLAMEADETYKE